MKGRSSPRKGVKLSAETKTKIREAVLRQHTEGKGPDYRDPIRNKRISDALRGKKRGPQSPEQMKKWWSSRRNSQCL